VPYGLVRVHLATFRSQHVFLHLDAAISLAGRVVDERGRLISHAWLRADQGDEREHEVEIFRGEFTMRGLAARPARLSVVMAGDPNPRLAIVGRDTALAPPVAEPITLAGGRERRFVGTQGAFTLNGVIAGEIEVSAFADHLSADRTLTVPPGGTGTVELTLAPPPPDPDADEPDGD
jgi:hypothetical protein